VFTRDFVFFRHRRRCRLPIAIAVSFVFAEVPTLETDRTCDKNDESHCWLLGERSNCSDGKKVVSSRSPRVEDSRHCRESTSCWSTRSFKPIFAPFALVVRRRGKKRSDVSLIKNGTYRLDVVSRITRNQIKSRHRCNRTSVRRANDAKRKRFYIETTFVTRIDKRTGPSSFRTKI